MNKRFRFRNAALPGLVAIVLFTYGAAAQEQQITALVNGMAANAKQIKQYTFKQRTETYYKNELRNAKIDEVHYSMSGERVSIPLDGQMAQPESHRRGPGSRLIAKKIEDERKEMKEYIERLMALTSRYLASDPTRLQAAIANAEVTTGGGSPQVRVTVKNFVKTGDMMTMSFDSATRRPTRTEVSTTLDDAPVAIVLAFDQIHDGPNYPGRTVVVSAARQLEVRILTYDYRM